MAIFPRKAAIFPRKSPFSLGNGLFFLMIAPAAGRPIGSSHRVFVMPSAALASAPPHSSLPAAPPRRPTGSRTERAPPAPPTTAAWCSPRGSAPSSWRATPAAFGSSPSGPTARSTPRSPAAGAGVLALRDRDGDGKPEERETFGPGGANDVELHDGYLYLALTDRILRWKLAPGRLVPAGEPETVVADLPDDGDHKAKSLAFGSGTTMFVNIASATNSCQRMNRMAGSQGVDPCRELERHAGIWALRRGAAGPALRRRAPLRDRAPQCQRAHDPARAPAPSGRRCSAATSWATTGASPTRPTRRTRRRSWCGWSDGDDFGWPYCYYSVTYDKKVLAPEYGGDGRKVGRCAAAKNPVIAFPGHWAPLALAFHSGDGLGAGYSDGLFVAFHGSWNRAPMPQAGYRVVFAPFVDGKATGKYVTFASGPNATALRASGLAVAADGSLFLAADANGKIWRISRKQ